MFWFTTTLPPISTPKGNVDIAAAFAEHGLWLLQVTTRLVASRSHAEDIVQETFIVLHKKSATLERGDDLRGWLYGVAKNLVLHHRRTIARQIRLAEKAENETYASQDLPVENLARRQVGARVQRAVATLSIKHREVFVLFELQGEPGERVAKMVGVPMGTVWTRLHHARAAFETAYARIEREEGPV